MRVFRRVMLGGGIDIDIDALPDTQKLYYKATAKVTPKSNSLGAPVIANKWDATTGEGIIACINDITTINNDAFNDASALTSITIPNSVTSIGMGAFTGCSGRLTINSKIVEIDYTLDNCPSRKWLQNSKFTELIIGDNIEKIGSYTFYNCTSLTSITIPDSVTSIGMSALSICTSLTSVTIPNSVTSIGKTAFNGCSAIKIVDIPNSVTKIGDGAFQYCTSLTSITIPDSVTSIGDYTFLNCTSMQYYDFSTHETVPKLSSTNAFLNIPPTCKIIVPDALYDEWIVVTNWSTYASNIIKESDWRTEAPDGVSIQHINGKFYTTDAWVAKGFSNDDANGVAVKNEQCGFVIAKTYFFGAPWSSDASNLVNGILTTTSSTEAKMDFAGAANTELMLATDTSGAAYICSNYTFPNGAKGYLPAAGEADVITQNRTTIYSAMTLINGNTVPNNPIWSSTQYSSTDAWIAWNRSLAELEKKEEYCYIVVVTAIKNEDDLTTNTEEADYVEYTE